jgi:hypothetical protein
MSVSDRIKLFISSLKISQREFCRIIGEPLTFVSSMRKATSAEKIHNILMHFPQLSLEWLMFGTGEMLCPDIEISKHHELSSNNVEDLIEIMKLQAHSLSRRDDQIDRLIKMLEELMSKHY